MNNSPALLRQASPFPAPASRSFGQWSALEYIVSFLALIAIPSLIYLFFFALKCPLNPFMRRRRGSDGVAGELSTGGGGNDVDNVEVASDVKYRKDAHVIEIGSECPVCLSAFNDGEEVRQLTACKHSFHALCIDLWLQSHSNCPICRASVHPSKIPVPPADRPESGGLP